MRVRCLCTAVLLLLVFACGPPTLPKPTSDPATRRSLSDGNVVGFAGEHGAHVWLGIPYAASPVGALRWRAPQPPAWEGEHEALAFGPRCPQRASSLDSTAEPNSVVGEEDCLTLNLWAPADAAGRELPVMVWIHGGGNIQGGSDFYDGAALAKRHGVVVVTVNYRLGPLGWMRHVSLREGASYEEESGNFAMLDLIHALHWVRANASAFGGDPERVTIFGESAGARNVLMLLVAPAAHGLFHGAIVQSGGVRTSGLAEAESSADAAPPGDPQSSSELLLRLQMADGPSDRASAREALAAVTDEEIGEYLRARTPAEIIDTYEADDLEGEDTGFYTLPQMFRDGIVLPEAEPRQAYATGDYARVPVILGTNRDEAKLFMYASEEHVSRVLGVPRLRDAEAYEREARYRSRFWKATGVDEIAAAMRRVQGASVYAYRFDWDEQPSVLGADLARMIGAAHAPGDPLRLRALGPGSEYGAGLRRRQRRGTHPPLRRDDVLLDPVRLDRRPWKRPRRVAADVVRLGPDPAGCREVPRLRYGDRRRHPHGPRGGERRRTAGRAGGGRVDRPRRPLRDLRGIRALAPRGGLAGHTRRLRGGRHRQRRVIGLR